MHGSAFARHTLATAVLADTATLAQANISTYDTQGAFLAAVTSSATDTFNDLPTDTLVPGPLARAVGDFSYTATATSGDFFTAGNANTWLSTDFAIDSITFSGFSANVNAIGGRFFGTDIEGNFFAGQTLLVTATDTDGSVTSTLVDAKRFSFLGFVSDGALASLTISAMQPVGDFAWPTVNNLILATAPVPEPASALLLLAGLGLLAGARGTQRARAKMGHGQ